MEYGMSTPLPAGRESMAEFDALDVDGLLTLLNAPGTSPLRGYGEGAHAMQPQAAAYRGVGAVNVGSGFSGLPVPSAGELFMGPMGGQQGAAGTRPSYDSDDSGKGEGDGRPRRGAEQKAHAIQEKNRRAQKRFRERQKARMKDMTEQLDDMGSELGKLRMENNSLKNRNSILEKVLALRDEHIRVLQDEQQVFDVVAGGLPGQGAPLLAGPGALPMLTQGSGGLGEVPPNDDMDLAVAPRSNSAAALAAEIRAVKSMPAEAVVSRWKDTVRQLGNILVQIEGCPDPADPRHQEGMDMLHRVLEAAGQLCMHTAVLRPTNMQRLIAMSLDDGRSGVQSTDRARWAAVTASLALSEEQASHVIALRRIFLRRMARVVEDRKVILGKLQALQVPERMVALQSVISEALKVNECTVELKANLQEEHLAGMEFIGTVFKTVFDKLQKARAIVQSYPFYPDIYQIATLLAIEREGPNALETPSQPAPLPVAYPARS